MCRLQVTSLFAVIAVFAAGPVTPSLADQVKTEPGHVETAAIRAAAKDYLNAKRQGNAKAMHGAWTADAEYVDANGRTFKVHELIDNPRAAAAARSDSPSDAESQQSAVRLVTPDVAIEDGTSESGAAASDGQTAGRYTAVWVKQDGRWRLDSLRESASLTAASNPRLQPLAWLLGEWAGKAGDTVMLISARWSDGGKYMIRDFVVQTEGGQTITGTQRIGWDPLAQKIKSWSFDSQGGAGEALWREDGLKWIVDSTDVTEDGKKSRSLNVYTPDGENRFVWEVQNANIGGEKIPPRRIEFKRAPEVDDRPIE